MAIWVAVLLLPVSSLGRPPQHTAPAVQPRAYYTRCPSFHYRGKHKLFRHAMACAVASRKARYVLKNRRHPPGWHCSLDNLREGYGACTKRGRAFEFLPL